MKKYINYIVTCKVLNTDDIIKGKVISVFKNYVAIGYHYVSWYKTKDLEIIKYEKGDKEI